MFGDLMQILIGIAVMIFLAGMLAGIGVATLIYKFVKEGDRD